MCARTFRRLYRNFLELVQGSTTLCNYCLPTVCVCVCARNRYIGGCIVLYRFRFPSNDRDRYLLILAGYISVLGSPCEICIFHAAEQIEGIIYRGNKEWFCFWLLMEGN